MSIVSFSSLVEANGKTVRENNLELEHKIPLGALVEVKYDRWHGDGACEKVHARMWVHARYRDCDGTPLYSLRRRREWEGDAKNLVQCMLAGVENGFSEEKLTVVKITDKLKRGVGALEWGD